MVNEEVIQATGLGYSGELPSMWEMMLAMMPAPPPWSEELNAVEACEGVAEAVYVVLA